MRTSIALIAIGLLVVSATPAGAQSAVDWDTLAKVKLVKQESRFVPSFGEEVARLEGQIVELKGFMLPLDQAAKQENFILSANPVSNCFFCMPGGPESLIEVKAGKALEFSYDPIVVRGKLVLLEDDPMGMFYRLEDASLRS